MLVYAGNWNKDKTLEGMKEQSVKNAVEQLSIFSSAELPANRSVSPASEKAWLTRVATSRLRILPLLTSIGPEWLVWENVPGVLSADGGEAFGAFLGGLGELGYGWAYRVLDAQYFGLAQRRKRVFVVASLGGWQRAAAVLFDSASLRGDSAPSREAREGVAPSLAAHTKGGGGLGTDAECDGALIPVIARRIQQVADIHDTEATA